MTQDDALCRCTTRGKSARWPLRTAARARQEHIQLAFSGCVMRYAMRDAISEMRDAISEMRYAILENARCDFENAICDFEDAMWVRDAIIRCEMR